MNISIDIFDSASINEAVDRLNKYAKDLPQRLDEICEKLAKLGELRASLDFAKVHYDSGSDVSVSVEKIENGSRVLATGESVLFIEYGAGATYGYGHPEPNGYGPGTYPGKGHWNDPNGWYYKHGKKSYGNPPAAAMYNAKMDIQQSIDSVADEVLSR